MKRAGVRPSFEGRGQGVAPSTGLESWVIFRTRMRRLALALGLSILAAACAHGSLAGDRSAKSAEEDYKAGEAELKSKNHLEAQKLFDRVRTKYPYSKYAALAELRIADGKFAQDKLIEAADAYQTFVKMHPNHEEVDYAAFRVGLARWKDAPGEFILFPPSYERDQTSVIGAITALEDFIKSYPGSQLIPEAKKVLSEAKGRFADRDWYVAEFYRKRNRWPGVAMRLEHLVREYPGSARESEALLRLAEAYLEMNERFRAQQALQQLVVKHPQDPRRAEAEKLLASIR
jgi:outer membrane protein assembly factor BamD